MKDWDDWSDFEINKAVFPFSRDFGKCHDVMSQKNPNRSALMWGDGANWFEFDVCNSWSDMGPIIVNNGIEISPLFLGEWCASVIKKYTYEEEPIYDTQNVHKNPLRAAAIVFLEMNGVKP